MTTLQSLLLGVVQGLTEFLPISSTAHLVLTPEFAPKFFGFTGQPPHAFDVALHIGTLLAVIVYFRDDWVRLFRGAVGLITQRRLDEDINQRMALLVVLGCIPAGIAGLLLQKKVEALAEPEVHPISYLVMGAAMILVGLLMGWVDSNSRKTRSMKSLRPGDATFIGLAQAVALIPGVSRSGSTITAGLMVGLTREAAARYSFLLSAPIIFVAAAWDSVKLLRHAVPTEAAIPASAFIVGIIASGVVGWLCIHFLIEFLRRRSLWVFVFYRLILGAFLIGLYWHNH